MPRKKENETIEKEIDLTKEIEKDIKKEDEPKVIKGIVNASGGLRIREEMNTNCKVIDILPYNTEIEILEVLEEWVKIEKGYLMKRFVDIK